MLDMDSEVSDPSVLNGNHNIDIDNFASWVGDEIDGVLGGGSSTV
jgi:hypothetical protein